MCLPENVDDSHAVDCALTRVHGSCGLGQSWDIERVVGGAGLGLLGPRWLLGSSELC